MNSHLGISKYEQYQNKEFSICNKYKGIGVCIHCVCKDRNMIIPINYTNKPNLFFSPFYLKHRSFKILCENCYS